VAPDQELEDLLPDQVSEQLRCALILRPLNLDANYRSCSAFPTHQYPPGSHIKKKQESRVGGREYFVVSNGDEGDEAEGKHREVLLRFDRNVVAMHISGEERGEE
jgi:hypothetical protein